MGFCDLPFNPDFSKYTNKNDAITYIDKYNTECLLPKIDTRTQSINKFMNMYKLENDSLITAQQSNKETMKLYTNDYYYIISKGIIYLLVMGIFIYFFGISNLINGVKITGIVIKDKAIEVKDKAVEVKDKIKKATEQKLS
jgi:hypothetical protein